MRARQLLSVLALLGGATHADACQLSMALEQWPPYIYTEAKGTPNGLDWELAQAILKEAGCTLQTRGELPLSRRQRLFEQGKLDLMLAASDTPERRRYARFSLPYRHETVGLFTRSGRRAQYLHLASLEQLAHEQLTLLAPRVGYYGPAYARLRPALTASGRLSTFISFQQGLRMLDAGRADLILGDSVALRHEAERQSVNIAALPLVVQRAPVHLMLNRDSTSRADLDRINAAIARLEQNGTLAAIRARYSD